MIVCRYPSSDERLPADSHTTENHNDRFSSKFWSNMELEFHFEAPKIDHYFQWQWGRASQISIKTSGQVSSFFEECLRPFSLLRASHSKWQTALTGWAGQAHKWIYMRKNEVDFMFSFNNTVDCYASFCTTCLEFFCIICTSDLVEKTRQFVDTQSLCTVTIVYKIDEKLENSVAK